MFLRCGTPCTQGNGRVELPCTALMLSFARRKEIFWGGCGPLFCVHTHMPRQEVKEKEQQVNTFLKRFQLTPEEKACLKGDISADFFTTLAKVQGP